MANELGCQCGHGLITYTTLGLCRKCYRIQTSPAYYQKHKTHILASISAYRQQAEFSTKNRKWQAAYRQSHRAECRLRIAAWAKAHPMERANTEARRRARKRGTMVEIFTFAEILERDKKRCGICSRRIVTTELSIDHIIPLASGGTHTKENVQLAHRICNAKKGIGYLPSQTHLALEV